MALEHKWLAAKRTNFGLEIEMKKIGLDQAEHRMKEVAGRARTLRPAMRKVAAFLRYELGRDWDSGGSYSRRPWAPPPDTEASRRYQAWKLKHYPASQGRVMYLTQTLRRALTTKYHPDHYEYVDRMGVDVGIRPSSHTSLVAGALAAGRIGGGVAKGGAARGQVIQIAKRDAMQYRHPEMMRGVEIIIAQYINTGILPEKEHM